MVASPSEQTIPTFAGSNPITLRYQRRTQLQYAFLAVAGLSGFYASENNRVRVAGLSCLFPGAGFLAVGGVVGVVGLALSVAFIPLSVFAWFGAGGLAFVLANWIIPALIAVSIIKRSSLIWEPAGPISILLVTGLLTALTISSRRRHTRSLKLRETRNALLDKEHQEWELRAQPRPDDTDKRELSIDELRMFQHFVQIAHQGIDDWSNYAAIDQFQTAAFRYQLYGLQWMLAFVQKYWMPSFHGYLKSGQEMLIEKSTTEDVMSYWKWESLWGKFSLDWNPAVRDNIMVTGYILLCLSLYEKLTGDKRYTRKDSLNFRITNRAQYPHNAESIFESLMSNWDRCSYCLFPCEPNWIYTLCNLVGMQGVIAYDTLNQTGRVDPLIASRFHPSFERDFMNPDGSVVTLRSAITGFPVIGIAGVIGDVSAAATSGAVMPNLSRRLWLISREAHVHKNEKGKFTLKNLVGADKIDVGNYTSGPGFAFSLFSQCAAEFGEEELARDLLAEIENSLHPTVTSPTGSGAVMAQGLSLLGCMNIFRARISKRDDWARLITAPPDPIVLASPKLDDVPFPRVMVASCYPVGESGVSFVVRGPAEAGVFTLGFKDLHEGASYCLFAIGDDGGQEEVVSGIWADEEGKARVRVWIGDRAHFELCIAA
ncbi:hypothetical protein BJX99DRAFT_267696 [Aspergillus californicus]